MKHTDNPAKWLRLVQREIRFEEAEEAFRVALAGTESGWMVKEVSATSGHNVTEAFEEACQRIDLQTLTHKPVPVKLIQPKKSKKPSFFGGFFKRNKKK